jgi:hypothetical protein
VIKADPKESNKHSKAEALEWLDCEERELRVLAPSPDLGEQPDQYYYVKADYGEEGSDDFLRANETEPGFSEIPRIQMIVRGVGEVQTYED